LRQTTNIVYIQNDIELNRITSLWITIKSWNLLQYPGLILFRNSNSIFRTIL